MQGPRERIDWHDWNMLQAIIASWRSPDPNTQVGAYICSSDNRPLGTGYNGTPRGIHPTRINWAREGNELETKYPFVVHAEKNAIQNAKHNLDGATLFVTLHPCNNCAIDIIQAGIKRIYYLKNPYKDMWQTQAAKWMFENTDTMVREFQWRDKGIIAQQLSNLYLLIA